MIPERREFSVDVGGERLDRYLAGRLSDLSRSFVQRLIQDGRVTVNGQPSKASCRLRPGDYITVHLPPPEPSSLVAEAFPLDIVYEDADLIVVNKPPGLVVHPAAGHARGTLVNALLAHCPEIAGTGGQERPGIVHRLDRDTSGLIVVAKTHRAYNSLTRQIAERKITKVYLALVHGQPVPPEGIIEAPVGRDPRHRQRMAVVTGGREARTLYRLRERLGEYALLEVRPETGRTHQIRLHLASIGHPVAGDHVYGRRDGLPRQFLHAWRLGFRLPSSGEYREFQAELPDDLRQVLANLRQSRPS